MDSGGLSRQAQSLMRTSEDFLANVEDVSLVREGSATMVQMRSTLDELEDLIAQLRGNEGPLYRVADRIDELGEDIGGILEDSRLPETTASIREASSGVGEAGDEAAQLAFRLQNDLDELRVTLAAIRHLAEMLERDPGALLRGRDATQIPDLER